MTARLDDKRWWNDDMISIEDFLLFADRTLDGWERVVGRLDDETINARPAEGANSVFVLVTHMAGATRFWTEHIILGLDSDRDRDAEFIASGSVDEAIGVIRNTRSLLHELAPDLAKATVLANHPVTATPIAGEWTVGAAMVHVYEELAQHLGHAEVAADVCVN